MSDLRDALSSAGTSTQALPAWVTQLLLPAGLWTLWRTRNEVLFRSQRLYFENIHVGYGSASSNKLGEAFGGNEPSVCFGGDITMREIRHSDCGGPGTSSGSDLYRSEGSPVSRASHLGPRQGAKEQS
ncbi:hypothetical protein QJS10_CPB11g01333 [Acorus calamus]|uniref:Uncharacterized protein n=1 Tax=Acorus calamus TaxID=4465 RepID=A0AAV9DTF7_ACOCL|nr:hypothetical protein QJS10_CPB11g01333 [Acorus calamus]